MKMVAWRVGNRGKWWFGRVLEGLGAPLGIHVAIFWEFLQKLGRRWAQDGRNWRQVAPKMGHDSAKVGQDGAKMVSFSSTWEVLEWFCHTECLMYVSCLNVCPMALKSHRAGRKA